jgi:hypothetical protein
MYDPTVGRFLEEDPIGLAGGGTNFYRYCEDDPVNASDPSGLEPQGSGALALAGNRLVGYGASLPHVEVDPNLGTWAVIPGRYGAPWTQAGGAFTPVNQGMKSSITLTGSDVCNSVSSGNGGSMVLNLVNYPPGTYQVTVLLHADVKIAGRGAATATGTFDAARNPTGGSLLAATATTQPS